MEKDGKLIILPIFNTLYNMRNALFHKKNQPKMEPKKIKRARERKREAETHFIINIILCKNKTEN